MPLPTACPIKPFPLPLLLTLLCFSFLCGHVAFHFSFTLHGCHELEDKVQPLAQDCKGLGSFLRAGESSDSFTANLQLSTCKQADLYKNSNTYFTESAMTESSLPSSPNLASKYGRQHFNMTVRT